MEISRWDRIDPVEARDNRRTPERPRDGVRQAEEPQEGAGSQWSASDHETRSAAETAFLSTTSRGSPVNAAGGAFVPGLSLELIVATSSSSVSRSPRLRSWAEHRRMQTIAECEHECQPQIDGQAQARVRPTRHTEQRGCGDSRQHEAAGPTRPGGQCDGRD